LLELEVDPPIGAAIVLAEVFFSGYRNLKQCR
jgi:hypothetical protein